MVVAYYEEPVAHKGGKRTPAQCSDPVCIGQPEAEADPAVSLCVDCSSSDGRPVLMFVVLAI